MIELLFSPAGRAGRMHWWLSQLAFFSVNLILFIVMSLGAYALMQTDGKLLGGGLIALAGFCYLAALWSSICTTIKRFHDRNKSAFWAAVYYAPGIGLAMFFIDRNLYILASALMTIGCIGTLWMFVELGFFAGDLDDNDFGPGAGWSIDDDIQRLTGVSPAQSKAPRASSSAWDNGSRVPAVKSAPPPPARTLAAPLSAGGKRAAFGQRS
jgi:uncharacterized membrane protein YhaH (DUF805 family)